MAKKKFSKPEQKFTFRSGLPENLPSMQATLFLAYSAKDILVVHTLKKYLSQLKRIKYADEIWDDGKIERGDEWIEETFLKFRASDIIILLISDNLIASENYFNFLLKDALQLHRQQDKPVIGILLKECKWENTFLGPLTLIPKNKEPLDSKNWPFADEPYRQVINELKKEILKLRIENSYKYAPDEVIKDEILEKSLKSYADQRLIDNNIILNSKIESLHLFIKDYQQHLMEIHDYIVDRTTTRKQIVEEYRKDKNKIDRILGKEDTASIILSEKINHELRIIRELEPVYKEVKKMLAKLEILKLDDRDALPS